MGTYKIGSDVILVESLIDENDSPILLSSLDGYGIELYAGNNIVGKWGFNLTGFVDSYWVASGVSELTFNFPSTELTVVSQYYGRLYINYTDANFPDSLRDLYSNRELVFNIINP